MSLSPPSSLPPSSSTSSSSHGTPHNQARQVDLAIGVDALSSSPVPSLSDEDKARVQGRKAISRSHSLSDDGFRDEKAVLQDGNSTPRSPAPSQSPSPSSNDAHSGTGMGKKEKPPPYTQEQNDYIKHLREQKLSWTQITNAYNRHYHPDGEGTKTAGALWQRWNRINAQDKKNAALKELEKAGLVEQKQDNMVEKRVAKNDLKKAEKDVAEKSQTKKKRGVAAGWEIDADWEKMKDWKEGMVKVRTRKKRKDCRFCVGDECWEY